MGKLKDSNKNQTNVIRRIVQLPAAWVFIALLFFISAGTIKWPFAWLFLALLVSVDLYWSAVRTIGSPGRTRQ